ncbi:hypothetical protein [Ralstonia phage RP13]|nr:hypothetical protein [Ralstonia phage RP13]
MPTYTYSCDCGRESQLRKISERDAPRLCKNNLHTLTRSEVELLGLGAPLLYSLSSQGTRACDKTPAGFKQ